MSYRDMLLIRSQAFQESELNAAMDYLALRNREALRAWRVRRVTGGFHSRTVFPRAWLPSWLRPEIRGPR
jgi:hypothetical protein